MNAKTTKKSSKKPKTASKPAPKAKTTAAAAAPLDPKKAFEAWRPRAASQGADVAVARVSASVARVNVDATAKAIAPYVARIATLAPTADAELVRGLASIAYAFEFAEKAVPKTASDGEIGRALAEVGPVRIAALGYLEAAAFVGLVDGGRVRAIQAGRGKLDIARDAVQIAALFDDSAAELAGKHPFTDAHLALLRDKGAWLVSQLKPGGAVRDKTVRLPASLIKDQFAALLEKAYASALLIAVGAWGVDGYRAHVPALHTHARSTKKKSGGGGAGGGAAAGGSTGSTGGVGATSVTGGSSTGGVANGGAA